MLKRVRWFGAGAALGVGATVWAHRKIRTTATRYRPGGLAATAAGKARALPADVRAALHEGRSAMRQREAELRYGLEHVAES
jgi:hypothetical protein